MQLKLASFFIIFLPVKTMSQTWMTGDNSTVKGCSTHCGFDDYDLSCWNSTLDFFTKVLIGQLRHYITVQVDIDQWYRRNGKSKGQDMDMMALEIEASFLKQLKPQDILLDSTIIQIAKVISGRIRNVSDHIFSWTPHFQCPLPCEYRHNNYRNLFIASMILNICLLLVVIPYMTKFIRNHSDWNSETRIITS
ncbi:hypothetical protein DICVIV_03000 [Dictyocaulus viviparus]|uniref:Neurotransmitter-gated ion-channel ligand-binding domain-containing protein n=1 Tax=Dictyocaulus viviparus TaxID=29172 RepID=A0A0D8Y2B9_DICVI|nr:hypothetical protein DICVIV_03000 [Dictyocaulus viviparus]